jgi:hypothetical protein
MDNPFNDPIGQRILRSFGSSHNDWRSLGGIERASGLSCDQVESYFREYSDWFIQSPISPSGIQIYKPNWGSLNHDR